MKRRSSPKPAQVRYNDWRQVALPPPEEFTPALPVSVIMPCYQTPPAVLARTLAALAGQTWPRDLFEVVIVDDGSEPPLAPPPGAPPNVRVVRQERRGFGIARARNTGVRAAAHSIILFLDGDSLPEAGWLAAHARWHHAVSDVVTVGFRASVAMEDLEAAAIRRRPGTLRELFADRPVDAPWIDGHLLRMADMTTRAADLFHVVVGGNFGIGREFYRETGGSDESFMRWGIEDTELAYRAYTRGGLFVPVRSALVWHQGREAEGREAKERSLRLQMGKAANLIPHPRYRSAARGRIYAVPRYVATVEAGHSTAEQVAEAAVNLLTDRAHDLVVRIEIDGKRDAAGLAWLREVFGPDPRVHIAPARSRPGPIPGGAVPRPAAGHGGGEELGARSALPPTGRGPRHLAAAGRNERVDRPHVGAAAGAARGREPRGLRRRTGAGAREVEAEAGAGDRERRARRRGTPRACSPDGVPCAPERGTSTISGRRGGSSAGWRGRAGGGCCAEPAPHPPPGPATLERARRQTRRMTAPPILRRCRQALTIAAKPDLVRELAGAALRGRLAAAARMAVTAARSPDLGAEKIISRKYRYIWLCVPKAASRSIMAALQGITPDDEIFTGTSAAELFAQRPEARDYYSFAFVRNPYTRALSFYADLHFAHLRYSGAAARRRKKERSARFFKRFYGLAETGDFDDFCRWLNTPWASERGRRPPLSVAIPADSPRRRAPARLRRPLREPRRRLPPRRRAARPAGAGAAPAAHHGRLAHHAGGPAGGQSRHERSAYRAQQGVAPRTVRARLRARRPCFGMTGRPPAGLPAGCPVTARRRTRRRSPPR